MRTFTVAEAARELGVSRNLIYALCQRRKIRHERYGLGRGVIRIAEDALAEYQRSRTVQAAAGAAPTLKLKHLTL